MLQFSDLTIKTAVANQCGAMEDTILKNKASSKNNFLFAKGCVFFTKYILLFGIIALCLSSCISTHKGYQSSPIIARDVTLDPIKADITVYENNKLRSSSEATYFLLFLRFSRDRNYAYGINYSTDTKNYNPFYMMQYRRLSRLKSAATYKAMQHADYDLIVHPTYTTMIENYLWIIKKYNVSVSGYGAKYSNFRTERQKVIITCGGKEYVIPDNDNIQQR